MTIHLSSLLKGLVLDVDLDQESYNPATKRFTDRSAYGNHGTSANAASFVADRMGQADRATNFNGSSDYVGCGSGGSLDITDAITISAWTKLSSSPAGSYIVGMDDAAERRWALYYFSNDKIRFFIFVDGVGKIKDAVFTPTLNQWYHVMAIADGSNLRIYINCVEVGNPFPYTGNIDTDVVDLLIGKKGDDTYHLNGSIANVRIYNRVLTSVERTLLYESYRPRLVI